MSDIFKAIAEPNARRVLETLAENPELTASKLEAATNLKSEQLGKHLSALLEADLLKTTGSGASKKYSLNAKGFTPYVSWLAKVAETQAVANLELQLVDLGEKLGNAIAAGSDWVSTKVSENISVDVDPKQWGKELGKILADVKKEVQSEAREVAKEAEGLVEEVKRRVKR
jgi:DNA-binding transcriptional ArsR family regulator